MTGVDQMTRRFVTSTPAFRALLSRPALVALALLLLNDHVLKHEFPSLLSDKLSDFAGLFFAPYVLLTIALVVFRPRERSAIDALSWFMYGAVALVFTALKGSPDVNHAVVGAVTRVLPIDVVPDVTDLFALASLPLSYLQLRRCLVGDPTRSPSGAIRYAVLASAVFAITATSSPQPSIYDIAADSVRPDVVYTVLRYTRADGLYERAGASSSWKRITTKTGAIVAHPRTAGVVFLIGEDDWDPSLDRIDASSGNVVSIKPPSNGPRPRYVEYLGRNTLAIGAWSRESLFFLRQGELLRSQDEGRTWTSALGAVRAVATTNVDNVLYALSRFGYVYRSDDAGDTWTTTISIFAQEAGEFVVDPQDPNLLLATAGNGLWRSDDGGRTWERRLLYSGESLYARWRIAFDRLGGRMYVVFGYGGFKLMRSDDRGRTWRESGIDAADAAVDPRGSVFVVNAQQTRAWRGDGGPPWQDITGDLPVGR